MFQASPHDGVLVLVGVGVFVGVGLFVGVEAAGAGVLVGVLVGELVNVAVLVGVSIVPVGVLVGVFAGVGLKQKLWVKLTVMSSIHQPAAPPVWSVPSRKRNSTLRPRYESRFTVCPTQPGLAP